MLIREGAAGIFANFIVTGFNKVGLDINNAATHAQADSGKLVVKNSIFFENGKGNSTKKTTTFVKATLATKKTTTFLMKPLLQPPTATKRRIRTWRHLSISVLPISHLARVPPRFLPQPHPLMVSLKTLTSSVV